MKAAQIRAVFARRLEALVRLDARAAVADYADDCVLESPLSGIVTGRDAVEQTFRTIFAAFPDATFQEDHEPVIFSDRAVQFLTIRGTDSGGLGQAPTGRPFSFFEAFLFTFRDGQIVYERRVYDFAGLLFQLAGESGIAGENSRLYRAILDSALLAREIATAAKIQQALMPPAQYAGVNFEIVAASVPCRAIGGDFVDYFPQPDGSFSFVLGDVAGKGPPAALLAAVLQGIFAANALRGSGPALAIAQANEALLRRAIAARFATAIYGSLSPSGRLTYCNAGHNPPLLIGKSGVMRLETGGTVVGTFEHATFTEETVQLQAGDVLLAYSDGVTEALNPDGEEFGEEQLLCDARANCDLAPPDLVSCLLDAVHRFSGGAPQSDDLTLLTLRFGG